MACMESNSFTFFNGTAVKFHLPSKLTFDAIMNEKIRHKREEKLGKYKACICKLKLNNEESNRKAIKSLKDLISFVQWPSPSVETEIDMQTAEDAVVSVTTEPTGKQKNNDAVESASTVPKTSLELAVQKPTETTPKSNADNATSKKTFEEMTEEEQIAQCQIELAEQEGKQLEDDAAKKAANEENRASSPDPKSGDKRANKSDNKNTPNKKKKTN